MNPINMQRSQQLANRIREVYLNGRWIANTNYKDIITQVDWKQATTQVNGLNTIALLTFHIDYYLGGLLKVFQGGPLEIRDKYSFDMPPLESEEAWQQMINRLLENAEAFAQAVENMTDAQLDAVFFKEEYGSYQRNIEVVIEHGYYHLGQLSLLRKMID